MLYSQENFNIMLFGIWLINVGGYKLVDNSLSSIFNFFSMFINDLGPAVYIYN